jgi:hypothetical protein
MAPLFRRGDPPVAGPTEPTPIARPEEPPQPAPPEGAHNLIVVILDSLRHDSALAAAMSNTVAAFGSLEQRWSYASWTAPSHYNLLMGLLPHTSPSHVYASEYYKRDFIKYTDRLGVPDVEFRSLLPSIFLPTYLKHTLGYRTGAMVSMPVLNRHTPINRDFDVYEQMPAHNDFPAMVDRLRFDGDRPWFWLLNVGETHYPYALPDEDPSEWPRISGVHGVFKHLDDQVVGGKLVEGAPDSFFDDAQLAMLRDRQIRAARHCDATIGRLFDAVPEGTWVVVTADHGELFGEMGYFGHGPIMHEKCFEVPYLEGRLR